MKSKTHSEEFICKRIYPDNFFSYYLLFLLPVFVAGEKKLKTGEKMVPSRVVRGGLPVASELSSLPFGLMGLLGHVIVSKGNVGTTV